VIFKFTVLLFTVCFIVIVVGAGLTPLFNARKVISANEALNFVPAIKV